MDSDEESSWIEAFLATRGHEFFCEVDVDFLTDRFNLTGLAVEGERIQDLLDIITGPASASPPSLAMLGGHEARRGRVQEAPGVGTEADAAMDVDEPREEVGEHEVSEEDESDDLDSEDDGDDILALQSARACHLYGMIHARFILSTRGLQRMMEKYTEGAFGRCQRALCRSQALLPVGLHDQPRMMGVKMFCPKCEDLYHPASSRHAAIDGAYFGTSFPAMLFQVYPRHVPRHTEEQYVLKVFGFKLHDHAELARWQQQQRARLERRIDQAGIKWF